MNIFGNALEFGEHARLIDLRQSIVAPYVVLLIVVSVCSSSVTAVAQSPDPERSWMDVVSRAADLYDARGFLKDKSRSVDGEVSVSPVNGNVQYRHVLSQQTRGGIPITFSLTYNQNASYTTFAGYSQPSSTNHYGPSWKSLTRNRPVWMLGVNGFAIQAFTWASRNVLHASLRSKRSSLSTYAADEVAVNDKGLMWLLDGYDNCNRNYSMKDVHRMAGGDGDSQQRIDNDKRFTEDKIRLLREDGSVLELIRREPLTGIRKVGQGKDSDEPFLGTFITTDANSTAYAEVTVDSTVDVAYSLELMASVDVNPDEWPKYVLPRLVRYFPGDGTTFLFREVIAPYGKGQLVTGNQQEDFSGAESLDRIDATPSVFYLTKIFGPNGYLIAEFEYDGHNRADISRLTTPRAGRANCIGFDGHKIMYRARGVTIDAGGRRYELDFDDYLLFGSKGSGNLESFYENGWDTQSSHSKAGSHKGMTWLLTGLVDPENRVSKFTYQHRTTLFVDSKFPRTITQEMLDSNALSTVQCLKRSGINGDVNFSALATQTSFLTDIQNQTAGYRFHYSHDPTSVSYTQAAGFLPLGSSEKDCFMGITSDTAISDVYDVDESIVVTCDRPLVNRSSSTTCSALQKLDRRGTSLMQLGDSQVDTLWSETYSLRESQNMSSNSQTTKDYTTTVRRITYGGDSASVSATMSLWRQTRNQGLGYLTETLRQIGGGCSLIAWPPKGAVTATVERERTTSFSFLDNDDSAQRVETRTKTYHPWIGNAYRLKNEETVSTVSGKTLRSVFHEYEYQVDTVRELTYASARPERSASVRGDFFRPLAKKTVTTSYPDGPNSQWKPSTKTESTYDNLPAALSAMTCQSYPNVTKLEMAYRWRMYYLHHLNQPVEQNPQAMAELIRCRSKSDPPPPWLTFSYIDDSLLTQEDLDSGRIPDFMTVESNDGILGNDTIVFWGSQMGLLQREVTTDLSVSSSALQSDSIGIVAATTIEYHDANSELRGKPKSKTSSGRGEVRSTSEEFSYGPLFGPAEGRYEKALTSIRSGTSSRQDLRYNGQDISADAYSVTSNLIEAAMVINELDASGASRIANVPVKLLTFGSLANHLPTSKMTIVQKPTPDQSETYVKLLTCNTFDMQGNILAAIDENRYLSRFEYDNLGRLRTAWMPKDFPDPDKDGKAYAFPNYDVDDTVRIYELTGQVSGTSIWKKLLCDDLDDLDPIVLNPIPTDFYQRNGDIVGGMMVDAQQRRFELGRRKYQRPDCSNADICGTKPAGLGGGLKPDPNIYCRLFLVDETNHTFTATTTVPRNEHLEVDSARIRIQLTSISADLPECIPILFTVASAGAEQSWEYYINCPADDAVSGNSGGNTLTVGGANKAQPYEYDLVLKLNNDFNALLTSVGDGSVDIQKLTVVVKTADQEAYGTLQFSFIDFELFGGFNKTRDISYEDFTLGYRYLDEQQRRVGIYAKIDDRTSTFNAESFPTQPTGVHARHARRRVTFTTDDLVKHDEVGFDRDYGRLLSSTLQGAQKSTTLYDGAARPVFASSPTGLESSTSYDALGRPTLQKQEPLIERTAEVNGNQLTFSQNLGSESRSSFDRVAKQTLTILSEEQRARLDPYVDVELSTVVENDEGGNQNSRANRQRMKVLDRRGRTVYEIDGVSQTNADGLNLVTEYRYDNLNRVVQVINPAGQSIEYTYDDWGNIASTNQVDMGRVDYSYDKHGFLRFSQTREQRQRGMVLSRQYDALGRITMISEASLADVPKGDQPVLPMIDPDTLHIGSQAVHGPYVNHTHVQPSTQQIPTIYKPQNAFLPTQGMVTLNTPCPDLLAEAASNRFNPAQMPMTTVIERDVTTFQPRMISASTNDFENAALYPEFILQSIWYDELPPQQGAVWGGVPPANVWNKLALHGAVRNLLGRPSTVAYRTDASQPFHYITRSYDERGRVECILRLTENIGYDAVYYAYNSSNSIISVHVVDARGQHVTFYGYDQEGRVCKTWTRSSADGFGPFMEPRRPKLLTLERDGVSQQPVAEYQYNLLNQVSLVTYPKISVTTTNTYNATGALLRSTTQQGQRPYYDEAFSYSRGGMITDKFFTQDGESRHETYGYDQAARLTVSRERTWNGVWIDNMHFDYDAVGNRMQTRRSPTDVNFHVIDYAHTPGTNQLTRVSDVPMVNGVTAGNPTFDDVLTYDPDGSMTERTKNRVEGGFASQSIEDYTYDAFNLVRGYRVRRASAPVDGLSACRPDASTSPADVWSYRFGPLQEREQKRQLVSSADTTLAWVYTLVGADGRQLATYNGLQGSMCGRNGVRLWPVEFNTYGPNNTRIITRADGTSEVVISDYLGSARVTLSTTAEPLQSSSYHPYGTERTSTGSGARTSYIGREHDKETDLGFYGVRFYEPEYGRFLSTDVLWGKHLSRQPYHYALNNPVTNFDFTGLDSNQRAIIVSAAEDYLGSGSTYQMGSKGQPGKPVDCSGLVNNCLVKAGEQSTLSRKDLSGGTGVERIEKSGEKVPVEAVVPGNVVTFRTGGSWSYHTGVVVVVRKGEDGKVQQMDFIHSSSKNNGPVKSTINFLLPNSFWTKSINGFFKVDTKPETTSKGQSKKSTESGSNTNESLPKTGG